MQNESPVEIGKSREAGGEVSAPFDPLTQLGFNGEKYIRIFGSPDTPRYQTADEAAKHMFRLRWTCG
jgi:hypothetical protein